MGRGNEAVFKNYIIETIKLNNFYSFVETGTWKGETSVWASTIFKNVYTIEAYKPIYDKTISKHGKISNIAFYYGNSKTILTEIIAKLTEPSIFWLDAHFSGEDTFGNNEKCPLMTEIAIINSSKYENIILIDDFRMFQSPQTINDGIEEWPNIIDLFNELNKIPNRYIIILEDIIFCVPAQLKSITAKYAQISNTNNYKKQYNSFNQVIRRVVKKIIRRFFTLFDKKVF
jgi:hypothetical protein